MIRRNLENYTKLQLLGSGTFGQAFLALSNTDQQKCVIKEIDLSKMNDLEQKEAYKEAKILESLKHPNIIKFIEVYYNTPKLCIVMEYADAGDLQNKIKQAKGKFFNENQILDWFIQICLAVRHIHQMKILHRDIKSQNVFLTKSGKCLLGDFGIARVLSETKDYANTVIGTPYYLSPEILENKPYKYESDIWAMGVLLYELCALKPPFDASTMPGLALKIVRGNYEPLPSCFSKELKDLVNQMLKVNPAQRPNIQQILDVSIIKKRLLKTFQQQQQNLKNPIKMPQNSNRPESAKPILSKADKALCLVKAREYRAEKERLLHEFIKKDKEPQNTENLIVKGIAYTPIVQPLVKKNEKFERIRQNLISKIEEKKNSGSKSSRNNNEKNYSPSDNFTEPQLSERDTFGNAVLSKSPIKNKHSPSLLTPSPIKSPKKLEKLQEYSKSTQETEKATPLKRLQKIAKSWTFDKQHKKLLENSTKRSSSRCEKIEESERNNEKITEFNCDFYEIDNNSDIIINDQKLIRKYLNKKFGNENVYKIIENIKSIVFFYTFLIEKR